MVKCFNGYFMTACFHFFSENNLISPKKSVFRPGDSCINQLLSIAREIPSAFDDGHEVRSIFLYISKAFDRVFHGGLHFKLQQNRISGELITLIQNFLSCRVVRVVLNGKNFSCLDVKPGVPQGSLFSVVHNITNSNITTWKISFNPDLTKQAQKIIFSRKTSQRNHPGIMFNNSIANVTTTHKHLGVIFDSKLSFNNHLKSVLKKISKTVGLL